MSHIHTTTTVSSSFQLIFNNALKEYEKRTKNDLLAHPLAPQLQACDSPSAVLAVLQLQVQGLHQSQSSNVRWTRWLNPTVDVLYAFSATLGEGVGLVFSPAKVIFAGVGVLLLAAKDVRASQDTLVDIFERIEGFFRRLEIYTKIPPTPEMMDMIMQIMVEVLSILGIATKEMKQGRTKTYMKKLVGRTEMEDSLKRLDKLTQEEARMATAQVLKIAHTVEEGVRGITDKVVGVDDRVANVDDRVACIDDRVRTVDDKVTVVIEDGKEARVVIQQAANDVDEMKRNQRRQDLRRWLSPPDPSTNHNIASSAHHEGTAAWFFQGRIFREWKTADTLLWVHGKPGSGKSVFCSSIIEDIAISCKAGQASMCYFYFDFRDIRKQHWQDLVRSLLTQLSNRSGPCCDILSRLYEKHDNGAQQPSDGFLEQILKEMLKLHEHPIYLMIDALDECSNTSGIPSSRERVLVLLKDLVELRLPNLHICVTSRPEIDIRNVLEPLTARSVCLHDQSGQKQDIMDYVRSIVYSKSEPIMSRWRNEDKEVVIATLSERADGMFRWVYCQLETLRHCFPSSVRRTLDTLPESLDETYERVLREIKKPHRDHALRLLECLVVATRPLRVEELAEVLAVNFDVDDGIPKLDTSWRWEDQEHALLSSCSSLISIVRRNGSHDEVDKVEYKVDEDGDEDEDEDGDEDEDEDDQDNEEGNEDGNDDDKDNEGKENEDDSNDHDHDNARVVQFAHFSVKEFLTSPRLAAPIRDVSHYYIDLEPAHTIMAKACLSVLLRSDVRVGHDDISNSSPLAKYAAEHWATHAQFKNVSSSLRQPMELLFNVDRPYFGSWLKLHNIDTEPPYESPFYQINALSVVSPAGPIYYAALCGFRDLAEHLIVTNPQGVNASGGYYVTPCVAALAGRHFQLAHLLHGNGSSVNSPGHFRNSPLHSVSHLGGYLDIIRVLIEYGADVNAQNDYGSTPLYWATNAGLPEIVRVLLEQGADPNIPGYRDATPLRIAVQARSAAIVRLLLEHGVDVNAVDKMGKTALEHARERGDDEIVALLSARAANVS